MALRDVLSELIPDAKDIRLLLIEAAIPLEYVPLTGSAQANWQNALSSAEAQGKWPRLIVSILQRFPEHTALWRALGERAGIAMPPPTEANHVDDNGAESDMAPDPPRGGEYVTFREHSADVRKLENAQDELERRIMAIIERNQESRHKEIADTRHDLRREFAPTIAAVQLMSQAFDRRLVAQAVIMALVILGGVALLIFVGGKI